MCELGRYLLIAELDQAQILLLKDQIGEKRGEATEKGPCNPQSIWMVHLFQVCLLQTQSVNASGGNCEAGERDAGTEDEGSIVWNMSDKKQCGMYVPLQTQHCIVHFQGLRHPRSKRTHCGAILAGPERRERPEPRRVSSSQEVGLRCLRNFHASELLGFVRKRGYRDTSKLPCELGTSPAIRLGGSLFSDQLRLVGRVGCPGISPKSRRSCGKSSRLAAVHECRENWNRIQEAMSQTWVSVYSI